MFMVLTAKKVLVFTFFLEVILVLHDFLFQKGVWDGENHSSKTSIPWRASVWKSFYKNTYKKHTGKVWY